MATFCSSTTRDTAARDVAEDRLTNEAIAAKAGVKRQTLDYWKRNPEFQARVAEIAAEARAAIKAEGIANKQNRVDRLNRHWLAMQQVIDERADMLELRREAGGTTGLIVKQIKNVGGMPVEEFGVDVALLKEIRAHEEQAAKELGQWVEKQQSQQSGDLTVKYVVEYTNDWRAGSSHPAADASPGPTDDP